MIKKYEIITVEGKKRIKALRSFSVQGRYVNVGDVGGIVYDENTLSQEGNAWIISGNLGYPSIRVSGDSIVDTNGYEGAVTDPRPFVNITGTSALIGAHEFITGKVSTAKVLAVGDVEQGSVKADIGYTYDESKTNSSNSIRTKSLIYMGGASVTVTLAGGGYNIRLLRYGADKKLVSVSAFGNSANTEGAYYIGIHIRKAPLGPIVPADITAADISIPSTALESTINIKDSRIEFNYTSAMTVAAKVNAANTTSVDTYKSVIDGSNLVISKTGDGAFVANILADVVKCNVEWKLISNNSLLIGNFYNIGRLVNDGSYAFAVSYVTRNKINARDCYTFTQSEQVIPKDALSALSVSFPFKFIRCNVENGIFYHNPVNLNVYTDIDFSKASADLGKALIFGTLCSSEVEGMYRVYHVGNKKFGALVESYDSIKDADFSDLATMVATTIYKDAKLTGLFNISGTNVFGGTGNHGGGKGCEITNTKETEMVISGNVRVEGNAKVKDTRIVGTGYFGGNSVTENAYIDGSAYVTDNGVFSPAPEEGKSDSDIHIEDNAKFLATSRAGNTVVYMCGDSEFSGVLAFNTISLAMYGKSRIAGRVGGRGVLILEDNADTSDKGVEAYGCIRLVGNYRQTIEKKWTGRRTISSENEPTYDDNVKTKYDF
jgi:hypothetical protein|nr:MAG TPA_asm: Putative transferase, nesg, ydcK, Structural Genomics.38A [Caudoviricetes sp.]